MANYYFFRNGTNRDIDLGLFTVGRTAAYQTYRIQSVPPGEEVRFRRNYHIRFTVLDPTEEDLERMILASVQMDPLLELYIGKDQFHITVHTDGGIVFHEVEPVVV